MFYSSNYISVEEVKRQHEKFPDISLQRKFHADVWKCHLSLPPFCLALAPSSFSVRCLSRPDRLDAFPQKDWLTYHQDNAREHMQHHHNTQSSSQPCGQSRAQFATMWFPQALTQHKDFYHTRLTHTGSILIFSQGWTALNDFLPLGYPSSNIHKTFLAYLIILVFVTYFYSQSQPTKIQMIANLLFVGVNFRDLSMWRVRDIFVGNVHKNI